MAKEDSLHFSSDRCSAWGSGEGVHSIADSEVGEAYGSMGSVASGSSGPDFQTRGSPLRDFRFRGPQLMGSRLRGSRLMCSRFRVFQKILDFKLVLELAGQDVARNGSREGSPGDTLDAGLTSDARLLS